MKPSTRLRNSTAVAVAALSVDLQAVDAAPPAGFRLLPYGYFKAADGSGRPHGLEKGWYLDRDMAVAIASAFNARSDARVIDFEHQTLNAEKNGQPAPAAGWIGGLEDRDDGLYAVSVEWTAAAAEMIVARQYRYVSPVFPFDKRTGRVLAVAHAALVNFAGLDGLTDLAGAAALSALFEQETLMNEELLEQLRWLLNLPVGTSAEEIIAHLQKVIDQLKGGTGTAAASGTFDLAKYVASREAEVATLKAEATKAPDPAKFVSMEQYVQMQSDLAALSGKVEAGERDGLMDAALGDGRILPAQEAYWRGQPLAALKSYLDVAQPVAALTGTQTGGKGSGDKSTQQSDVDVAVMKSMGLTAEQFAAGKQEE